MTSLSQADWNAIEWLKAAGVSLHVIATGAGSGIQSTLWSVPGASAFLSGCSFPYAAEETVELLGFAPEQAVSEATAIDLACAAYMKAYRFGGKRPIGLGVTAAVATDRKRRGADRAHACVIDDERIVVSSSTVLPMGREAQGRYVDSLALCTLFGRAGIDASGIAVARFLGRPYFTSTGERLPGRPDGKHALLPGAFNPPHAGHLAMAAEVERERHIPAVFHVTARAPNKPELTVQELLKRAKLLRGHNVLFTRGEALYIEKARRFPDTPIVMGADALARMLEAKWGPDVTPMLYEFASLGTTFLVAPRRVDGHLLDVDTVTDAAGLDPELKTLFLPLSSRVDVSSTELRRRVA